MNPEFWVAGSGSLCHNHSVISAEENGLSRNSSLPSFRPRSDPFAEFFELHVCTCENSCLLLFPSLQVGCGGQGLPLNPTYDIIFPLLGRFPTFHSKPTPADHCIGAAGSSDSRTKPTCCRRSPLVEKNSQRFLHRCFGIIMAFGIRALFQRRPDDPTIIITQPPICLPCTACPMRSGPPHLLHRDISTPVSTPAFWT